MPRWLLFVAAVAALAPAVVAQPRPSFKPLRYDEDYAWLRSDTLPTWYDRLKYTPLAATGAAYVSVGGEVRYQYFGIENESWGEAPADADGYVLSRLLLHAHVHLSAQARVFVQLQGSGANGKIDPSPVDENPLDLHQAFVEYQPSAQWRLRAGRQEFSYGSQRLISVRELPNNRQSFDAVKIMMTHERATLDFFYAHYVQARDGIFDDASRSHWRLWGAYAVARAPVLRNIDVYYLGMEKEQAVVDDAAGNERRHSMGVRVWDQGAHWSYDFEGVYQLGKFGGQHIRAWTVSSHASYLFRGRLKPRLGLKTELISGNAHYNDTRVETFNPLFPRGAYFGLAAIIGPSNLADVHPSLSLDFTPALRWSIDYDVFWRYSRNDGVYAPNGSLLYSGKGLRDKFIGRQCATDLQYTPVPFLLLKAEFTWFIAGSFLKAAGPGENMVFAGATAQLRF